MAPGTEPKTVELFYDFSSPNAYYAAMQLPAVAKKHGARIVWRPFLLGAVFKTLGTPPAPLMSTPAKAEHTMADMRRWSERYAIPFRFPSRFPMNTVKALRAALAIERAGGDPAAFVEATFRAYWVDDRDLSDVDVLAELLRQTGHDAETILAATERPDIKEALKQATSDAIERNVFGAPTFFVGGELFFGKDRLDFVEAALEANDHT